MAANTPVRILSLGWGVQSWTIAAMIALGELPPIDYAIHADTTWERTQTYAHAARWTPWLEAHGVPVRVVRSERTKVLEKWESDSIGVMIPAFTLNPAGSEGQLNRQCTRTWKINPIRRFISAVLKERGLRKTPGAVTSLQGISWDEALRMRTSDVQYITNEYPLINRRITRQSCIAWLEAHDLPVPVKSACVFCPYHSRAAWLRMARAGGEDYKATLRVDEAIRHKWDSNFDLFVHPARRPLSEAVVDDGQLEMWPEASCDSGYCFT